MENLKTKIISFNDDKISTTENYSDKNIFNFSNSNKKTEELFLSKNSAVELQQLNSLATQKAKLETAQVKTINEKSKFFPSFYSKELKRCFRLFVIWIILSLISTALAIWSFCLIFLNQEMTNWIALMLIPPIILVFALLIFYGNKFFNFRSEAKTIDFSKEKTISINVVKLYKRLKTASVNINWMCSLTYVAGLLVILFDYVSAWASTNCQKWTINPDELGGQIIYLIILICSCVAIFLAFFLHVYLLLTANIRSSKIDNFYSVEIVSREELSVIKKQKNKRDFIIFFLVIAFIVLIGILIYKIIKKNSKNQITINN